MKSDEQSVLVSIIVPVYNVAPYLGRCIESILHSINLRCEVILVDDGSTDGSEKICDMYQENNSNIRVIHKKNEGVSVARNVGIDFASGKYLLFVDSDDYISVDMINVMLAYAQQYDVDFIQSNYCKVDEHGRIVFRSSLKFEKLEDMKAIQDAFFIGEKIYMTPWGKLIKKAVVDDIRMVQGRVNEDVMYLSDIIRKTHSAIIIPEELYYYYQRNGSIMKSEFSEQKMDSFFAYEYILSNSNHYLADYSIYVKRLICLNCFYMYDLAVKCGAKKIYVDAILDIFSKYKKDVWQSFKNLPIKKSLKNRLLLFDMNPLFSIKIYNLYLRLCSR